MDKRRHTAYPAWRQHLGAEGQLHGAANTVLVIIPARCYVMAVASYHSFRFSVDLYHFNGPQTDFVSTQVEAFYQQYVYKLIWPGAPRCTHA